MSAQCRHQKMWPRTAAGSSRGACSIWVWSNELRLMIFPVVIGEGKRLFDGIDMHAFELADLKTGGDDGVIV
jgi:hypothetical protein